MTTSPHLFAHRVEDTNPQTNAAEAVDWCRYAGAYDQMATHNPAYQDLIGRYTRTVRSWTIPAGALLVDLGAGTGNFSQELARSHPDSRVLHVDCDKGMNAAAGHQSECSGLRNFTILEQEAATIDLLPGSVAAPTVVHAMYAMPQPEVLIERVSDWLMPGGWLLAVDPGAPIDLGAWSRYLIASNLRSLGPVGTARLLWKAREAIRQNRRIQKAQSNGVYWRHDAVAFREAFQRAGLAVLESATVYRGCSDWLVARKPAVDGLIDSPETGK